MAVAEMTKSEEAKKKVEKNESGDASKSGSPSWVQDAVGFVPRKWADLTRFLVEVRAELKKVTWPSRQEVYTTTLIIIGTTVFFGFYLWLIDLGYTKLLTQVLR
jgi:preprotein translocase subunit SecE